MLRACFLCLLLAALGCSREEPKPKGIVGIWDVLGENLEVVQTFGADGRFSTRSKADVPWKDKAHKIELVFSGSYKLSGSRLTTELTDFKVASAPEDLKENLEHNARANLGQSVEATLKWHSDDQFEAILDDGKLLLYRRKG